MEDSLYKSHGVLWRTYLNIDMEPYVISSPLCPNETCHRVLDTRQDGFYCVKCDKVYPYSPFRDSSAVVREVNARLEGFKTMNYQVFSLDLPPTKVSDEDKEDENYWVQARIVEQDGKKMAVVYFGERVKDQTRKDYTQVFLDFEDEQLRFDKSNKNPMKLLAKLTAEFFDSTTELKRNSDKRA